MDSDLTNLEPAPGQVAPPVSLRLVVMPTEHGGWSFLGEPILLGLLVAPSWAGMLIALGAVAAFLARQPLKLLVSDRRRGKIYPRTRVADRAFGVLVVVAAGAVGGATWMTAARFWPAVAAATPLAALALAFDLDKRSREAAGELSGALALGAVATTVALAGGWRTAPAFALWGVLASRAVPTILYVRARLRREKGQPAGIAGALAAHGVAIGAVALLAARGLVPWAAAGAMIVLAVRAALMLSPRRPRLKTWQLGVSEVGFGLLVVLSAALARGRA